MNSSKRFIKIWHLVFQKQSDNFGTSVAPAGENWASLPGDLCIPHVCIARSRFKCNHPQQWQMAPFHPTFWWNKRAKQKACTNVTIWQPVCQTGQDMSRICQEYKFLPHVLWKWLAWNKLVGFPRAHWCGWWKPAILVFFCENVLQPNATYLPLFVFSLSLFL